MSIHIHHLDGCAPQPLAHYLKALGILRLVSEQADSNARGWWQGNRFKLATTLDQAALKNFFLNEYQPTPIVAPWNRGSGFFKKDDALLSKIRHSTAARLMPYREAIVSVDEVNDKISYADSVVRAIKDRTKTNKTFQSEEQRALLESSAVFQEVLAEFETKGENATASQVRSLISKINNVPSKGEVQKIKSSSGYKRLLDAAESRFKEAKSDVFVPYRKMWRGKLQEWMDSALVITEEGDAVFPSLLGTGGNDRNFDFTYKFMGQLGLLFDFSSQHFSPRERASTWLDVALYNVAASGLLTGKDGKVGQFFPAGAGGANCIAGFGDQNDTLLNPADYVLMLEGVFLFVSTITKKNRQQQRHLARAAVPFAISFTAAAFTGASADEQTSSGEQWMPLWERPSLLNEVKKTFAEGRAQVGKRSAEKPLDMARAAAGLGISRGITSFVRYGYLERNGQSTLAVPLGHFHVTGNVSQQTNYLSDIEVWLQRLERQARAKNPSARLKAVERQLMETLFAVVQHPNESARWQAVLMALADVESVMVKGTGFEAGPVPPLRPEWAKAADDNSPEFRLALSFALQSNPSIRPNQAPDCMRRHWLPLNKNRFATSSEGGRARLQASLDVVIMGRDGVSDAIAVLVRRLVEGSMDSKRGLELFPAYGAAAWISDIALLLSGAVDINRVMTLARALMAVDANAWKRKPQRLAPPNNFGWPDDLWLLLRLALSPWPLESGLRVPHDPAVLRRLAVGDCAGAVEIAHRRLHASGLKPKIRAGVVDANTARLWAAALAFPLNERTMKDVVKRVVVTQKGGEQS